MVGYPFFIYNGEIARREEKERISKREQEHWDKVLKDNPNYYLDHYDLENIWSAENVMNVIFNKPKRMMPVYKYVLDEIEEYNLSYDIEEPHIKPEPKRVLVGYKIIEKQ